MREGERQRGRETKTERERERERDRQTNRQTDRQRQREKKWGGGGEHKYLVNFSTHIKHQNNVIEAEEYYLITPKNLYFFKFLKTLSTLWFIMLFKC